MWYKMSMTGILQVPLYMGTMMPSTGNGSHAIITIVYVFMVIMIRYYSSADGGGLDWGAYTSPVSLGGLETPDLPSADRPFPRQMGLFQNIIALFYNIQAESTFRKPLRP